MEENKAVNKIALLSENKQSLEKNKKQKTPKRSEKEKYANKEIPLIFLLFSLNDEEKRQLQELIWKLRGRTRICWFCMSWNLTS